MNLTHINLLKPLQISKYGENWKGIQITKINQKIENQKVVNLRPETM
jgi:hypothetical protein